MTLTSARGPLGPEPAGRFSPPIAPGTVYIEPHPRRVNALVGGEAVLDTEAALLVHRPACPPSYAFPRAVVGDLPHDAVPEAPGYVQVPWDAVDRWVEEGRTLVHHPPNPYHRVDCRPTTRHLRVEVAGAVLVDTDETIILFETALEPKLYAPRSAVRTDLLRRSPTSTYCSYKGEATYWSAAVGDTVVTDVAWSYEDPYPESTAIGGWFSFDPARADVIAELPQPSTLAEG
ncbi:MAG: DUF427 domain-containing protein [Acidimicrobiales bacterium]